MAWKVLFEVPLTVVRQRALFLPKTLSDSKEQNGTVQICVRDTLAKTYVQTEVQTVSSCKSPFVKLTSRLFFPEPLVAIGADLSYIISY